MSGIKLLPNRVLAWFFEQPEQFNSGLYVPEEAQFPISVAQVVASTHEDYKPGDKVLAPFNVGKKVSGFDLSGVEMPGIVGMYGQAIDEEITREGTIKEFIVEVEMSTQLPAKIDSGIVPTGNQLLILRDPLAEEEGGILLIDKSKERGSTAKVLQAGPRCENVSTGDNVVYFSACVRWVDLDADKELRELTMESYDLPRERLKDLALISEADVVMIYD